MDFLLLEDIDSTNSYVATHAAELRDMTMVMAARQSAGRGQRGNSWESEPGKNLTFTLLYRPVDFPARNQFAISEAVALAIVDFLIANSIGAKVKWPNDIYVADSKISGILIEHSLQGSKIEHSRIGVGLNVNQSVFLSDAPNPVSMTQLSGKEYEISRVAAAVGNCLERRLAMTASPEGRRLLHREFLNQLWRGDGRAYPFRRPGQKPFEGTITGISEFGPISVRDNESGTTDEYAFKEIEFLLADTNKAN
ncbi:MAG: biotin--[acetyl-CoA-carboxylase] ligase [Muribaculaceae bacterium]|nr:biotin--[acetyl-CoA-carboxylase] ligase [Muribaculaceae bacterium]